MYKFCGIYLTKVEMGFVFPHCKLYTQHNPFIQPSRPTKWIYPISTQPSYLYSKKNNNKYIAISLPLQSARIHLLTHKWNGCEPQLCTFLDKNTVESYVSCFSCQLVLSGHWCTNFISQRLLFGILSVLCLSSRLTQSHPQFPSASQAVVKVPAVLVLGAFLPCLENCSF